MAGREEKQAGGGIEFEYSRETLDTYRKSPAEWKLNWLEEANRLTFSVLDEKHRAVRDRIRRGLIGQDDS
jgi:hypothetical protein